MPRNYESDGPDTYLVCAGVVVKLQQRVGALGDAHALSRHTRLRVLEAWPSSPTRRVHAPSSADFAFVQYGQ